MAGTKRLMRANVGKRPLRWQLWCDPISRIVVRHRTAIALTLLEFAIFRCVQKHKGVARSNLVLDEIYRGVKDPPLTASAVMHVSVQALNRKLARIGIKVKGIKRRHLSEYRIEEI